MHWYGLNKIEKFWIMTINVICTCEEIAFLANLKYNDKILLWTCYVDELVQKIRLVPCDFIFCDVTNASVAVSVKDTTKVSICAIKSKYKTVKCCNLYLSDNNYTE